jgi:hypothetical protein
MYFRNLIGNRQILIYSFYFIGIHDDSTLLGPDGIILFLIHILIGIE